MACRYLLQPVAFSVALGAPTHTAGFNLEQEANCLLQSHRKQHKQALSSSPSLLQTGFWQTETAEPHGPEGDTAHKHGSVVLFDQLAALAEQDSTLSPTDNQMVEEVALMLEEVSIPALHTAHESDQEQVLRVASEVSSCDTEMEIVAQSPGGPASQQPALTAARDAHRQCRGAALVMHTAVATNCGELEALVQNLSPPNPVPPQPQVPSANFTDYLRVNDDFFATAYARYLELAGLCTQSQTAASPMPAQCSEVQHAFEQQVCIHGNLAEATCSVYSACRTARESEMTATRSSVEHLVMSRKLEFVTLMKIKCLIRYLLQEGSEGSEAAHECGTLRLEILYDGSDFDPGMFNISFPPVPEANPCAPGLTSPCDDAFRVAEYSGMDGLDACSACGQDLEVQPLPEAPAIQPKLVQLDPPPALAALQLWAGKVSARAAPSVAISVPAEIAAIEPEGLAPSDEGALGMLMAALG